MKGDDGLIIKRGKKMFYILIILSKKVLDFVYYFTNFKYRRTKVATNNMIKIK